MQKYVFWKGFVLFWIFLSILYVLNHSDSIDMHWGIFLTVSAKNRSGHVLKIIMFFFVLKPSLTLGLSQFYFEK